MSRLWKVTGAIAEYTVGTAIVLVQLSMAKSLNRQRRDGADDLGYDLGARSNFGAGSSARRVVILEDAYADEDARRRRAN